MGRGSTALPAALGHVQESGDLLRLNRFRASGAAARTGRAERRVVPTFTERSIGQGGTQLYPGSIATPTPQSFDAASPPPVENGFGVIRHHKSP
jgi:hypothetical protein